MNLTTEEIKSILDGAPKSNWTHYNTRNRLYFKRDGNSQMLSVWLVLANSWSVPREDKTLWLERRERLEEILALRQEVERLKEEVESVCHLNDSLSAELNQLRGQGNE